MPQAVAIASESERRNAGPKNWWVELFFVGYGGRWHEDVGLDARGLALPVVHVLSDLHKVGRLGIRDIQEGLRIAIRERKPGALNLHHDAMAAAKSVVHVLHREGYFLDLAGCERFRSFKTVAEFSAEWFSAHELLISAHGEGRRLHIG